MMNVLKGNTRRVAQGLVSTVIASAFVGLAVAGSASAASADAVAPQSMRCITTTGSVEGPGGTRHYAAAKCDAPGSEADWRFRLKWSCSGEDFLRTTPWHIADGTTLRGYCPVGQTVDLVGVDRIRQQLSGS